MKPERRQNSRGHRRAGRRPGPAAFSLLEVLAALAILGLASSSVLLVINRCVASAANSALRMEAFQLARENLEKILASESVAETVEYGTSDRYSDISWQTVIEAFPEPATGQMWARAVCSAEYLDSTGETQKIELEHWITPLDDQQAGQLLQQGDLEQLGLEQLLPTVEEAAQYAGVDIATIEQWVEEGLVKTDDGLFIKCNVDLFVQNKGQPTPEQKAQQVESIKELAMRLRTLQKEALEALGADPAGRSKDELQKMSIGEIMDLLKEKQP